MNCGQRTSAVQTTYGNHMRKRPQFTSATQPPADASAVQFTRNPNGIANALNKIRSKFGS